MDPNTPFRRAARAIYFMPEADFGPAWTDAAPMIETQLRNEIDPEAIIKACVPGGQICDPQVVADAIRDYFNR